VTSPVCNICRRADCRTEAHNGPDQYASPSVVPAGRFVSGLGQDCAVISNCRSRISRLPANDATVEARNRVLAALDEYFEVSAADFRSKPREGLAL